MKSGKQKKQELRKKRSEKREDLNVQERRIYGPYFTPEEWTFLKVRERYLDLAKKYKIEEPLEMFFDSDLSGRKYQLYYFDMIIDGLKNGDPACVELSVQLVADQVYFFWSGYTRAKMARKLKNVELTVSQKNRLRKGIYDILVNEAFGQEIKEILRLIRRIGLGKHEKEYLKLPDRFYKREIFRPVK